MRYPQTEETGAAIAFHVVVCIFVCGLFGFGFYKMFQPRQIPNPGLAAYEAPAATVIKYAATPQFINGAAAPFESANGEPSPDTPDETTGRAASVAQAAIPVLPAPNVNREAAKRSAKARSAETKAHQAPSPRTERTASSRSQPESRSLAAAYPGYAAIH